MADHVLAGRYRVEHHLARGGMAEVYLARDLLLDRPVALKVLFPELARDASFVERFRREAQAAARLNHPNIVSVYDFGADGEAFYIVSEYVDGRPLSDVIRDEGPMAPRRAVAIAVAVAAGLDAAHREGIVHRDVKPANVLVADGVVKVTDFGIARASYVDEDLTLPGMVIGTATYLSPEQARGAEVDQRSDLYSLALVLYEMLTGRAPFRGENVAAIAYKQLHEVLSPPSVDNPAVSPALDTVVARALSVDPEQRPGSAAAFRSELLAAVAPARPPVPPVPPGPTDPTVALPPGATEVLPRRRDAAGAWAAAGTAPLPPGPDRLAPRDPNEGNRGPIVAIGVLLVAILAVVVAVALSSRHGNNGGVPPASSTTVLATTTATLATTTTTRPATTTSATAATTTSTPSTTAAPTTTVAPSTTTLPASSTTVASSSTTVASTSTTIP